MTIYQNSYSFKHIIEAQQFDRDTMLNWLFPLADVMQKFAKSKQINGFNNIRGVNWFEEPSTRTSLSFAFGLDLLGGRMVYSTENAGKFSSRAKGESIEDTIEIINGYEPNIIVARFANAGDAAKAAAISRIPIINAGDGNNQHPTQALLDIYTIHKEFGRADTLKIGMVGDLANGRTVKSLSYLASKFANVQLYFISPSSLSISKNITAHLDKHEVAYTEHDDLREVASILDVIYVTRIQEERGSLLTDDERVSGRFGINQEVLDIMSDDAIIMHPLPRVDEIPRYVDKDPRARYFQQAQNGLYIRMALYQMILYPQMVPSLLHR